MSAPPAPCPFCGIAEDRQFIQSDVGLALFDAYPIAEGHTLVVPRRHVVSLYELPDTEQAALWSLVAQVRGWLVEKYRPDAFTIGVNDGIAAGQTVAHAHIHVIPRRPGDVTDPRGGIRWVIPGKAPYWEAEP
jgi:diadenosine tetraphosphate (Ap4A) HIT family hydrolase